MKYLLEAKAAREDRESFETAYSSEPIPPSDIVSFNELRSCADLYRMYSTGKLEIQPDFQREIVWKNVEQARFIDSLVKQLPIPSMCFSLDYKTQRWLVIDGLQRMSSIVNFLGDRPWKVANIDDIHPLLRGKTNVKFRSGSSEEVRLYSAVLDVTIPITVLRCDYSQNSHMEYLFTIFHRLNSGGVRLNNQEIRNCIYTGSFNDFLKEFDNNDVNWQNVKRKIWGEAGRFRSVELLLRAICFSDEYERYDGNLASFLNKYMHERRNPSPEELASLQVNLGKLAMLASVALEQAAPSKVSMTIIEALLVGILRNIKIHGSIHSQNLRKNFIDLVESPHFIMAAKYAISSEHNLKRRLEQSIQLFGEL